MSGGQTVGREGGSPVTRDEARARAAEAAEQRAQANATRGQQGQTKMKKPATSAGPNSEYAMDARQWD